MKKITLLPVIVLLAVSPSLFGQETSSKLTKRFVIQDLFIQPGMFMLQNSNTPMADFQSLAPESNLLDLDYTGYTSYSGYNSNYGFGYTSMNGFNSPVQGLTLSPMLSIMLGIGINNKKGETYKSKPLLRLGFSFFSKTGFTGGLFKSDRVTYDQFTSGVSGQTVFLDSITTKSLNMNYSSQQLRFDGSVIFRTDTKKRWSLFAGIGITAGLSLNAQTEVSHSTYVRTEVHFEEINNSEGDIYPYHRGGSDDMIKETFRNNNNFGASANIPIGIDWRLGKKRDFWKQLHLYYELRPGVNMNSIPELRTFTGASLQHGIGIKYSRD